jgi:hypothetical protein
VLVAVLSAYAIAGREPAGAPGPAAEPPPPSTAGPSVSAPVAPTAPEATSAPPVIDPPPPPPTRGSTPPSPTGDPTPTGTPACFGAVRYEVDVPQTEIEPLDPLCFEVGGVLALRNIEPGLVTAEPESLVAQSYEAGISDIRFLSPGTVTVTVPKDGLNHTIRVDVIP